MWLASTTRGGVSISSSLLFWLIYFWCFCATCNAISVSSYSSSAADWIFENFALRRKGKFSAEFRRALRCKKWSIWISFYRQIRDKFFSLCSSLEVVTHVWWFTDVYLAARRSLSYLMINLSTMFQSHSGRRITKWFCDEKLTEISFVSL